MIKIVGVRFRKAGKIYYFDPAGMEIETGTHVIVETARGIEFGTVMIPPSYHGFTRYASIKRKDRPDRHTFPLFPEYS